MNLSSLLAIPVGILLFARPCCPSVTECATYRFAQSTSEATESLPLTRSGEFDWTVDSSTETVALLGEVGGLIRNRLGLAISKEITVCLRRRPGKVSDKETWGESVLGSFEAGEESHRLTLLRGITRAQTIQVLSHEWTHAWQEEHCPRGQDLLVREGFAQWVTGKVLEEIGLTKEFETLRTREDFYGEAYRWAAAFERESGQEGLIEFVKETEAREF